MIETHVTLATRRAYDAAHAERARAIRAALAFSVDRRALRRAARKRGRSCDRPLCIRDGRGSDEELRAVG